MISIHQRLLNDFKDAIDQMESVDAQPVAIYQVRASRFVPDWTDVSPTDELFHSSPDDERRIVYAAPSPSASSVPVASERVAALQDAVNALFHSRTPLEGEIAIKEMLRVAKINTQSACRIPHVTESKILELAGFPT